ncbi:transposase [bacterium]|nr:transposase [bacterium]MBU1024600.1 transposase [bacterium]
MQTKREQTQYRMTLLPSLESFIPDDHRLRKLNKVLDLDFIHESVRDYYCQDNGRPSIDPEVVIRLFLLQAIEGITHVRELMREAHVNLAYRWFIGYEMDEDLPDHSTLSRALDRLGDSVFNELFERSISQCKRSNLIEGRVLHVDATTIRADIDRSRVGKADSSDKDARFGRFPDGTLQPGYKQQTVVDDGSRVVLEVSVDPANVNEGKGLSAALEKASSRLDSPPEVVCADSAYASGRNAAACDDEGIRLVSPPATGKNQYSDEQFAIDKFEYDEKRDVFICPSGKMLSRAGRENDKRRRWKYRASARDCRDCSLKSECTRASSRVLRVTSYHSATVNLRKDSQSAEFKALYRRRAPVIEGIFAEGKQWHGLARAWRRGLSKMRIQSLLISTVLNYKRLMSALSSLSSLLSAFIGVLKRFRALLGLIKIIERQTSSACL